MSRCPVCNIHLLGLPYRHAVTELIVSDRDNYIIFVQTAGDFYPLIAFQPGGDRYTPSSFIDNTKHIGTPVIPEDSTAWHCQAGMCMEDNIG